MSVGASVPSSHFESTGARHRLVYALVKIRNHGHATLGRGDRLRGRILQVGAAGAVVAVGAVGAAGAAGAVGAVGAAGAVGAVGAVGAGGAAGAVGAAGA